jgi:pSer/pThr/pTyr-binding forkhead associated (FHA) protein
MGKPLTFKVTRNGELLSVEKFEQETIKIGRLSSAHLRLNDEKVSRIHAVVEVSDGGEVSVIDMGSTEGTFVNGEKINKAVLRPGDEVRVGDTCLVFVEEESEDLIKALKEDSKLSDVLEAPVTTPASESISAIGTFVESAFTDEKPRLETEELEPTKIEPTKRGPTKREPPKREPPKRDPTKQEPTKPVAAPVVVPPPIVSRKPIVTYQRRVALPPPRELGELNDDPAVTPENWALEVRQLWGDNVIELRYFQNDKKQILVGESDDVDFFIPADLLPANAFPIARVVQNDIVLAFNDKATGTVVENNGTSTTLQDMVSGPKAGRDPTFSQCYNITLPRQAVATVNFGKVGFRFRYVSKPAGFISKLSDRIDYTFLNSILLLLFMYSGMIATIQLRPKAIEGSEEELFKVPDRYVQFILTRPKPEQKDLAFLEKLKADISEKAGIAPRAPGAEGAAGKKNMPELGRRMAIKAIKIDDKELVGNKGLLGVLSGSGQYGVSTVMGGSGLGGELDGAIGNLTGSVVGDSGGMGGLGLKGTGTGGGGAPGSTTIGVGSLGTYGRGGNQVGYGTAVAKLKGRGESNISISVGNPIIMGSLSMEIIRQVIQSHRDQIKYCYSQELTRNPNLAGKVSVKFTISPKGFVTQAAVSESSLNNAIVEQCIIQKIHTWKFPEPKGGGIVIVNYPFILRSQ